MVDLEHDLNINKVMRFEFPTRPSNMSVRIAPKFYVSNAYDGRYLDFLQLKRLKSETQLEKYVACIGILE